MKLNFINYRKSYILHCNEKYYNIAKMCIKSIRQYSDLPIYVYMINSDNVFDINGVTTIKWEIADKKYKYNTENDNFYIDRSDYNIYDLLIQKILITKHTLQNFSDIVAYIDSDSIATPYIDNIFSFYKVGKYPYFTQGIYQYLIMNGRGGTKDEIDFSTTLEHPICDIFKINESVRKDVYYRQSGYFVSSIENIDFLNEWYWMSQHPKILDDPSYFCPFNEETILNPLLWDKEFFDGLPLVYVNGTLDTIDEVYTKLKFTGTNQDIRMWFKLPANKNELLFFHGEKRIEVMENMINKINKLNNDGII